MIGLGIKQLTYAEPIRFSFLSMNWNVGIWRTGKQGLGKPCYHEQEETKKARRKKQRFSLKSLEVLDLREAQVLPFGRFFLVFSLKYLKKGYSISCNSTYCQELPTATLLHLTISLDTAANPNLTLNYKDPLDTLRAQWTCHQEPALQAESFSSPSVSLSAFWVDVPPSMPCN